MALDKTYKVPLPKRGVVKYKNKGITYIYYITRIYRNEKGKPTNDRICIGKLDEETDMLIPNRNYFEIFSSGRQPKYPEIESIKSCGVTYVIDGLKAWRKLTMKPI